MNPAQVTVERARWFLRTLRSQRSNGPNPVSVSPDPHLWTAAWMPLAAIDQVPPTEWNGVIVARANHTQDKESCAEPAATCRYVSGPCDLPYSDRSYCSRYCGDNQEDGQFLHHRVTRFGHAHPHVNQRHRKPEGMKAFAATATLAGSSPHSQPNRQNTPNRAMPPRITNIICMMPTFHASQGNRR